MKCNRCQTIAGSLSQTPQELSEIIPFKHLCSVCEAKIRQANLEQIEEVYKNRR